MPGFERTRSLSSLLWGQASSVGGLFVFTGLLTARVYCVTSLNGCSVSSRWSAHQSLGTPSLCPSFLSLCMFSTFPQLRFLCLVASSRITPGTALVLPAGTWRRTRYGMEVGCSELVNEASVRKAWCRAVMRFSVASACSGAGFSSDLLNLVWARWFTADLSLQICPSLSSRGSSAANEVCSPKLWGWT